MFKDLVVKDKVFDRDALTINDAGKSKAHQSRSVHRIHWYQLSSIDTLDRWSSFDVRRWWKSQDGDAYANKENQNLHAHDGLLNGRFVAHDCDWWSNDQKTERRWVLKRGVVKKRIRRMKMESRDGESTSLNAKKEKGWSSSQVEEKSEERIH